MLRLDTVILHNFKSFRHANIRFSKGFNCIVGPNGSGKSNICDSLLFALGESSLKRMRLSSFPQVINSHAKPKKEDNVKRAYVKLTFKGDEPLEIARVVKSNNKVSYRLNDRRVTRQDMMDVLRANRCEINETNTITQGEIGTLLSLNARERRELIDVAAGIKEFDDKKSASLKELEKVEGKIGKAGVMLNERKGFLSELEKEKKDAEKYIALTSSIKDMTYTILKRREHNIVSECEGIVGRIKEREQKRADIDVKIKESDLTIEKLSGQRDLIAKGLNERSIEVGSTNKLLESANKDMAVKESQLNSAKEQILGLSKSVQELKDSSVKVLEEKSKNEDALKAAGEELVTKSAKLKQVEILDVSGAGSLLGKYEENRKKLDGLNADYAGITNACMQQEFTVQGTASKANELKGLIEYNTKECEKWSKSLEAEKAKLPSIGTAIAEAQGRLGKNQAEVVRTQALVDKAYSDSVNVREQLAMSGQSSDKSNEILARSVKEGFHGRAYELCSYDDKYATAVQAAAGQRLSYFVVDSTEIASDAIKVLKEKGLGRASFIPLEDMQIRGTQSLKGLKPLIDNIKFEKRYESAFAYIFSNTYIVDSIEAAKKFGIGTCRFVTIEGELVEQSGIITGGHMRTLLSPVLLESKLKKLEDEKKAAGSRLSELNSEADSIRRTIAERQTEEANIGIEMRHAQQQLDRINQTLAGQKQEFDVNGSRLEKAQKELDALKARKEKLNSELSLAKAESEKLHLMNKGTQRKGGQQAGGDAQEAKALRDEVKGIEIRIATITKENEMLSGRLTEIEKEMIGKRGEMDSLKKSASVLEKELTETGKTRNELQEKIKGHDAKSAGLYKELQTLDGKISEISNGRGRLSSEMDRIERELIELGSSRTQLETRMSDIKAELLSYKDASVLEGRTVEELESGLAVAKVDVERLGAVNLKAPEIYESKRQDVESAAQKMQTLDNEKNSIVAMINEIESKKLNIFVDTLKAVSDNFKVLHSSVYEGTAYLYLENPKDPFNSGLMFHIASATNKEQAAELRSGGEKALTMLMLIFAIQMRNPMSFYIFDEIDAALDKENSKKLSRLMKELSKSSQVIMVSHNDSLITSADTAIGVVKKDDESQAVGMQITAASEVSKSQSK
jgi:chromosome segregation protein